MDPLSNPLILSNIFEQLPFDGKENFRQVCPLWEDSTLQSWRDNALVKILGELFEENSKGVALKEFVELLKEETEEPYRFSEDKPFRSFQLQDCTFYCPTYKTKEMEDEEAPGAFVHCLFEKIGPTIHRLQFCSSVLTPFDGFMGTFKWILLKACVNLKGLQIDPIMLPDEDRTEFLLQQGEFVQKQALNLVTLKLEYLSASCLLGRKYVRDEEAREFWNIIPNLKNLGLINSSGGLDLVKQLKHPLNSGKFIKLERLKFKANPQRMICYERKRMKLSNSWS